MLGKYHQDLYDEIVNRTSFLVGDFYKNNIIPMLARLYCLEHDIHVHPTCQHPDCHNKVKWRSDLKAFATYCSMKCTYGDEAHWENLKAQMTKNLGVDNPGKLPSVQKKMWETRRMCKPSVECRDVDLTEFDLGSEEGLKTALSSLIDAYPKRWATKIRDNGQLMNSIKVHTPLLQSGEFKYSLPTMVYWVLNGLREFPVYTCPVDGVKKVLSNVNITTLSEGYGRYLNSPGCCPRCVKLNPKVKRKCENTSMKNHGVPHFTNAKKAAATSKRLYGDNLEAIIRKRNATCIKLYGRADGGNSEQANKKRIATNMRNRGVAYVSQDESVKRKKEESYLKNIGVRNPMCSSEINNRRAKRWFLCWNNDIVGNHLITKDKNIVFEWSNHIMFDSRWEI